MIIFLLEFDIQTLDIVRNICWIIILEMLNVVSLEEESAIFLQLSLFFAISKATSGGNKTLSPLRAC